MTRQRTFKRRVRERMAKTGESYTAARRVLIARGVRPDVGVPQFDPPVTEERVVAATGRGWDEWVALLDGWGAASQSHTEIARRLREEMGVDGWYAQAVTLGYERARGLRAPGERPDGFAVSASRTIAVPQDRLFDAFEDEVLRGSWLPEGSLRRRTATRPRTARYDWEDGTTRVIVGFDAAGDGRSRVALSHERLPDAEAAAEMKTWWRERLTALKARLEEA